MSARALKDGTPADAATESGSGLLYRTARPFVVFVERFYPDPFLFVIALTFVALAATFALTDTGPRDAVVAWGQGLSSLLTFIAQVAITLVTVSYTHLTLPTICSV